MTLFLGRWLQARNRKAATGARTCRGAKRTRPHRIVPRLEALEDRTVPSGPHEGYVLTNLVSDIPNLAQVTDPDLKNPWGTAHDATGTFWVTNHGTSTVTQYAVTASSVSKVPQTVAIPKAPDGPTGPTGMVSNNTSSFLVNGTPASSIFANSNGTISAWNSSAGTMAQVKATTPGAHYTGLDMGSIGSDSFLYAANATQGTIDVFNGSFGRTSLGPNAFKDPLLPSGLLPFNVENIEGKLYVAYAPAGRPAAISAPEGVGAVAVFDTSGHFIKQLISGGKLASPWGITLAPETFGEFGGDLLVANFSFAATEINAFDPESGEYEGTLTDSSGNVLLKEVQGLWDLSFGTGGNGGQSGTLYFATGLNNEENGLFGAIDPEGGNDGDGHGDGVRARLTDWDVHDGVFVGNQAVGGDGPDRGTGQGGGISNERGGHLTVIDSQLIGNLALGGAGSAGTGGLGRGGGIANLNDASLTVIHSRLTDNQVRDGDGLGGGLYVGAGTASRERAYVTHNQAVGGGSGEGNDGRGVGGGAYVAAGTVSARHTRIHGDHASTSDDDVFGDLRDDC